MCKEIENLRTLNLRNIVYIIRDDWKKVSPYAEPYLVAMGHLDSINDDYYADSGRSVVAYFLSNAATWRGDTARAVKRELNRRLNGEY